MNNNNTCELCKLDISGNDTLIKCDVCFLSVVHTLCTKRETKKVKNNKWTCQNCSDIKPAHILFVLKEISENIKYTIKKIEDIEKSNEFAANKLKALENNLNIVTNEVQSLSSEISTREEGRLENMNLNINKFKELAEHQNRRVNETHSGVLTLLSIFDNDEAIPTTSKSASSDKLANDIFNLRTDVSDIAKNITKLSSIRTACSNISLPQKSSTCKLITEPDVASTPIKKNNNTSLHIPMSNSGWRHLGMRKIWRNDWTQYDAKIQRRELAEKNRLKQHRKRKVQQKQNQRQKQENKQKQFDRKKSSNNNFSQSNEILHDDLSTSSFNRLSCTRKSFRNKLSPPDTHRSAMSENLISNDDVIEINDSSINAAINTSKPVSSLKFINFQKGETLKSMSNTVIIDPLISPAAKCTQISTEGDGRYMLSRFNNERIYSTVRFYLAYLHNQPASVLHEGHSSVTSKIRIAAEGLPTDLDKLRNVYFNYNSNFNLNKDEIQADLDALRDHCSSFRISTIQKNKEVHDRFYNINRKNKNF